MRVACFLVLALLADFRVVAETPPATPIASATPSAKINAAFWNIQWFPGRRPNASRAEENRQIRAVQRDLAELNLDILGLEEVRDLESAAIAIKPWHGFKVDVCSNFPTREGQTDSQQIAIASRLQPMAAWAESWRRGGTLLPPRGFAFAAYQVSGNRVVLVYALHLKSNRGEIHEDVRIREESMHQLIRHAKAMNERFGKIGPVTWIIGGDFNTTPDEPRFAQEKTIPTLTANGFNWAWRDTPLSSRLTVPSDLRYPPAAFDQIFYRGALLVRVWVAPTSAESSDHRPVNVTLDVP